MIVLTVFLGLNILKTGPRAPDGGGRNMRKVGSYAESIR